MVQAVLPSGPSGPRVLSVAELTARVKQDLEADPQLRDVHVKGELSNMRRYDSGHAYFTLKDDRSQVSCVMWRDAASRLGPEIADGAAVVARGRIGVYPARGQYQLVVEKLESDGHGMLWVRLAELKKRLEAEGLFALSRKRPLPAIPARVGIVTSREGAALRDMLHVLSRRAPYLEVVFADARVQGADAAPSLVSALRRLGDPGLVDVLIIGRGGGSIEDLWAFNEEPVVRGIAACPVPVVSAVGHETDWTLSDFVADRRAPTPSAAAETIAPSVSDLLDRLRRDERRMATQLRGRIDVARSRLDGLGRRPVLSRPDALTAVARQRLDESAAALPRSVRLHLERARTRAGALSGVLDALSPLKTLARGYAVAATGGRTVRRTDDVKAGDGLTVRLMDGTIDATVRAIRRSPP